MLKSRFVTAKPGCLLCSLIWITHLSNLQDPALQELESNFVIQQKLVEAAKKLASEPDLCKNVKKKRKQEYADAVKKLQEIENSINEYRIKCGKKPTQKSTLTLPGKQENSPCSDEDRDKEVVFGSLTCFVYIFVWFLSSLRQLSKKARCNCCICHNKHTAQRLRAD